MASVELATAYVSLVPSMKGAQGSIARELGAVDADGIGRDVGGRMGGGIAGAVKGLVGPALAAAAAVGLGGFIAEAARASDATDKFKSTLNFAGLDTSAIDAATAAAKGYADETVYELSDIQKTMATLAANGVDDYTGITKAAGNLNAVAGGNAETFKSVSLALGQSAGAGKLMAEDWNMLADAIPGASGQLQDAMREAGAFEGNFKKAMEAGEISADEFQAAISKLGSDPIAVEAARSVTTFEGALGNLSATINSGLMGALDAMKPAITGAINLLAGGLGATFTWIGSAVTGLKDLLIDGDFTGALASAFRVEEDSALVGFLFTVRDGVLALKAAFTEGDVTSDGFVGAMERLGVGARAAFDAMQILWGGIRTGVSEAGDGALGKFADVGNAIHNAFTFGRDAMQIFVGGLRTGVSEAGDGVLGSFADAGNRIHDVFGQIGPTVGAVFSQIGPVLGPLVTNLVALWQAASPVSTIFAALGPSIGPLVGVIGTLAASVGGSLVQAITGILPAVQTLQGVFVSLFTDVLATVLPVVVQLVAMFGQTLATLIPVIVPIVTQIATLAATLVAQLAPIFMELVSTVLPMVVTAIGAILPVIGPLISTIAGVLIPVIQALMPVVTTVFGAVANIITSVMQIVMGVIQVVTGIISGNWSQVWTGIQNVFSGIWNTIVSIVTGVLATIGQVVISGLGLVAGFVGSTLSNIGRFFADTWNNVVNGVSSMIGNVVGFFSGLIGRITGAIGNAGRALWDTGVQIIQGLINGISSMMGAIGRAVLSIVPEAIRGPFEDLLGIHSPSRVFQQYGVNIGQGLINGIDGMRGRIASSVEGMVTVPTAQSFGSGSFETAPVGAFGGAGGGRMTLMVGGREFDGYVTEMADSSVRAADSDSTRMRRGRY